MGLKVNSYSIFGKNYCDTIPLILRAHHALYPGWQLRIYHDKELDGIPYKQVLLQLNQLNIVKTIFVDQPVLKCRSMLWRMLPIWDPEVDYIFCKDADSLVTPRERRINEDFVRSNYVASGINDNPAHSIPLMGGMIGFNAKKFIEITGIKTFNQFISMAGFSDNEWQRHGSDQSFLNSKILPLIKNYTIIYRTFNGASNINGLSCVNSIPNIDIDIDAELILKYGDRCTNYIGACGTVGPLNVDFYNILNQYGCNTIFNFFDRYGNQEVNNIIRQVEHFING